FLNGDAKTKLNTAKEVVDGFKKVGFIYLANHGISEDKLNKVYDESKTFFNLPLETKEKLAWETPESNRGYVSPGREKVTQLIDESEVDKLREESPDLKESMEIGKEPSSDYQNKWPRHNDSFRPTMMDFYETAHNLHMEVMRSIALGLGLEEKYFDPFCNAKDHNLRLLHYPTVERAILDKENQTRAG
ncbi:hypothetical protein HDU76_012054, partial [Blyttiomyces sp. JEL0837]